MRVEIIIQFPGSRARGYGFYFFLQDLKMDSWLASWVLIKYYKEILRKKEKKNYYKDLFLTGIRQGSEVPFPNFTWFHKQNVSSSKWTAKISSRCSSRPNPCFRSSYSQSYIHLCSTYGRGACSWCGEEVVYWSLPLLWWSCILWAYEHSATNTTFF